MEQIPNDLLAKIQKIINFQESSEAIGNKEQVETAAHQLQKLLMKHNLDLDQVKAQSIASKVNVSIEAVWINTEEKTKHSESAWIQKLYMSVARNNLCKVLWTSGQYMVNIVGHSHNVALVNYICDQLIDKIRITEKLAWKHYFNQPSAYEKRGTFRRGFLEGATYGIGSRLDREYNTMANHDDNPFGIVIRDKSKEVNEWLWDKYPWMKPGYVDPDADEEPSDEDIKKKRPKKIKIRKGPRGNSSRHGWNIGYDIGGKLAINKGMEGDKTKGQIN